MIDLGPARIGLGLASLGRPGYLNLGHGDDLGEDRSVAALQARSFEVLAEPLPRLCELAAQRVGVVMLDLRRVGGDLPVRRVDVAPLRAHDDIFGRPCVQPRAEELLAAAVGARRVEVADPGRVGGVEHLEAAGPQRRDRPVLPQVGAVAEVEVAGAAERREPEADPPRAALAGMGWKHGVHAYLIAFAGTYQTVPAIPLAPLPDDIAQNVEQLGAKQLNLYRCLAHAPELLRAWINFAWALRGHETTERRLRELMILRTATLHHSPYEWHQHRRMAREAGATDYEVAELEMWRTSEAFSDADRAALAFTDAIVAGDVPPAVTEELTRHFDDGQRVELTVTAAFYSMVPRVLDALGVPIEEREPPPEE